jgi:hypothetical protein
VVTVVGAVPAAPVITSNDKTVYLGYGPQQLQLLASVPVIWSPGAYLSDSTSANTIFTPVNAGEFTYTATTVNNYGCTAAANITLRVVDVRCGNKVLVCVKGKTECVPALAVKPLLLLGGRLGRCQDNPSPSQLTVFPNPVFSVSKVFVQSDRQFTVSLYNLSGRLVEVLGSGNGTRVFELNSRDYPAGLYFVKLVADTEVITQKVIIL